MEKKMDLIPIGKRNEDQRVDLNNNNKICTEEGGIDRIRENLKSSSSKIA